MPKVALFITCLVDLFRPSVGFSTVKLLEQAGYEVEVPMPQSCCGQPAFNSGDTAGARAVAIKMIELLEPFEFIVAPSGSCAGMVHKHYPELFVDEPDWRHRAEAVAAKTWELLAFLAGPAGVTSVPARYDGTVTYHDSCSGLRELDVKEQPRALLASVQGLSITEMKEPEVCCGFGGTFCVKYPDISNRMVENKIDDVTVTGADTLLAGDLGCLMNMAGKAARVAPDLKVYHVAEVLAGDAGRLEPVAGTNKQ